MALDYPADLKYSDSHEYVRLDGDVATVGITAFAIDQLGDIVFLELPEIGSAVTKGAKFGDVESVKAVEELKSPVTGQVVERNAAMVETPEQLIEDPYLGGWLIKVQVADAAEVAELMAASEYKGKVEGV
jgi:glycine cleavage system H protein